MTGLLVFITANHFCAFGRVAYQPIAPQWEAATGKFYAKWCKVYSFIFTTQHYPGFLLTESSETTTFTD